jgi:hypothetical protein
MKTHADIQSLEDQLNAADRDAQSLAAELTPKQGAWQPAPGSWSVAECLEHLAISNRAYIAAMQLAADRARSEGKMRRGPANPGFFGGWFAKLLEPPAKRGFRIKAPPAIVPSRAATLAEAFADFASAQIEVRAFLQTNADLDLARITFANPFIGGVRFSLASGLNIITVHERRHLWQAQNVRRAQEEAAQGPD